MVESSSHTNINDSRVRILVNSSEAAMVMQVSGEYVVNNSQLRGYVHSKSAGYLFYVAGAEASAIITVQNTFIGANFSANTLTVAFYGITVYVADIHSKNVTVGGKRTNYYSPLLIVTK